MSSVLDQLYHGDICPQTDVFQTAMGQSTTYSACDCFQEQFAKILQTYAPELESKFKVLLNELKLAYSADQKEMFNYGFSLAIKMVTEALGNT